MKKHLQISNLHIASIFAGIICLISIVFTGVVYAQPLRSNDQHGLNSTPNGTVNYTTLSTDVIRMSFVLSTDNGTGKKGSVMNFNSSILKENGSASFSKILAEDTSMPLEQMMVTPSTPLTLNCPSDITTSVLTGQCNAVVTYTTPSAPPVIPQSTQTFNYTGTIVNWTVPTGVTSITIKSLGARGGNMNGGYSSGTGGNGASIQGEYLVTPGEEIKILVGRKGEDANFRTNVLNTGGGGGSFVWKEVGNTLLISAGGGSGVGTCGYVSQGVHGSATLGGTGNGGQGGNLYCGLDQGGGGGAGWLTNGSGTTSNTNIGGISPLNGGLGGAGGFSAYGFISTAGGFGGGGGGGGNCGGPGGGGGYSGGNGGDNIICQGGQFVQGGTSYNIGINQINQTGINSADGQVTITYGSASYTVTQTAGLPTGSAFPVGTTTNTFEINDGNGNTSTCSFNVTVTDNIDPTITAPAATTGTTNVDCTSTNVILGTPITDDNCSVAVVTNDAPLAFLLGQTIVTWTVTDGSGNTAQATQLVTVSDNIDPTITAPAATTGTTNVACTSTNVVLGTPLTADNCSVALVTNDAPLAFQLGQTTVTWTVTDGSGNTTQATQLVTVTDDIDPTITAPANKTDDTDTGMCTKTFTLAQIGTATAGDNCSVIVSWTRSDNALSLDSPFPFGATTITWKATDGAGNIATSNQTINIEHVITITTVTVTPNSQQYSDKVTFVANVTTCSGAGTIGGTVEFKVGTQVMGSALVLANGTATLADIALLEPSPFGTTPIGQMSPGVKTVTATYSGDANYSGGFGTTNLTITPEVAAVTYNGGSYFTANPSTYQGTIMPSAFLVDAADGSRGDIRNATVTFRDGSVAGSALGLPNIPVGLVNPSITTDGFATTSLNYTLSNSDLNAGGKTWEVWTTAGKYYEGQADAYIPITLGLPGPEYVTGGGNTVMSNSSGIYAGDAGRKMNFGLVMKWNKSGKNLQGNINVIYRREDGNYQIKSNAINSLVIENVDNTGKVVSGSAVTFRRATISTKANFKRLNPDGTYTDLGGNLNLIVTAWESTTVKTGASDRIGLQLAGTNGTGINFSSNWSSGNTVAQQLSGGKIQVQTPTTKSAEIATATEVLPTEPTIKAYPNPFTDKLNIEFSNETNTHARLEIYNVTGSRLETLFDSNIQSGELYNIEYLPKLVSSQMVFYHLILGDKTYVGKAIYNERR